jgi:hypothetical protein
MKQISNRDEFSQVHFYLPRKLWAKFKAVATLKRVTATELLIKLIHDETSRRKHEQRLNQTRVNGN